MRLFKRHDQIAVSELQKRANPVRFGIVFVVILLIAIYFGFTKHIPFKHGYRLNAQFNTAVNIAPKSPVRIAGVNVGKVSSVRREGNTGVVTMEIEGKGLPIYADATLKIRPRIFLEGNFFVQLNPAAPRPGHSHRARRSRCRRPPTRSSSTRCSTRSTPTRAPTCRRS